MKKLITNYTFNKTAKTITFNDYANIDLSKILLITNTTVNKIIYNFAGTGGTVSTNVLTLAFDTSAMNNSDKLQIFYDDGKTTQDNFENPFGTAEGQLVTSPSETFFGRLAREGRWRCDATMNNIPFVASTMKYIQNMFKPSIGCILYPKNITFSVSADTQYYIYVHTGFTDAVDIQRYGVLKAGATFNWDFDGEVFMKEGGTIEIRLFGYNGGYAYGTVNGIEVAEND